MRLASQPELLKSLGPGRHLADRSTADMASQWSPKHVIVLNHKNINEDTSTKKAQIADAHQVSTDINLL